MLVRKPRGENHPLDLADGGHSEILCGLTAGVGESEREEKLGWRRGSLLPRNKKEATTRAPESAEVVGSHTHVTLGDYQQVGVLASIALTRPWLDFPQLSLLFSRSDP